MGVVREGGGKPKEAKEGWGVVSTLPVQLAFLCGIWIATGDHVVMAELPGSREDGHTLFP